MNEYFKLIWTLCFLGFFSIATEAGPVYLYSDPGAVDTPEEDGLRSEAEVRDLAFRLTGKPVEWKKVETADEAQWSLLEASTDFDLLGILPRNEQELQALVSSRADVNALPMILNHSPYFSGKDFHGHTLFLSALKESEEGMMATMVFSVLTPEDQVLHFTGRDILWTGDGMELCHMEMMLEEGLVVADFEFPITIKGSMIPEKASFVSFDCDGFDQFQLLCEYQFPADLVKPVSADQQDVKAKFKIVSKKLGDFIGKASVDPFEIRGLDDVQFEIKEAVVDYSTAHNHEGMLEGIDNDWPKDVRLKYEDSTWRGFFLKEFSVLLPEAFNDSDGQRMKIAAINFFADHGNGISGKVLAKPQLETDVEGWGISLDTVLLSVITNSFDNFKMSGRINIPIMTGTSRYDMLIGIDPQNNPEISFTLSLDGTYTFPFLDNSSLTLTNGSNAGLRYDQNGFVPHADLSGDIVVKIGNPSVTLPKLTFENLRINEPKNSEPKNSESTNPQKEVTGGLDNITIKAFSLGGDTYESSSGGIGMENFRGFSDQEYPDPGAEFIAGGPQEEGYYSDNSTSIPAENKSSEKNNSKLSGIPITINGIGFGKEEDDGESCYRLKFNIKVNFAADSKAFNSEGGFAVLGKLDFKKLISKEPWEALSFHKVRVDKVMIKADLGQVSIEGGVQIIDNNDDYGDGFKGGIKLEVKIPSAEFYVQCVGQFGYVSPKNSTHVDSFRYFFVDAEAGFGSGIQLGNTGLAIFGFSGGFFYNMKRDGNRNIAELAASKEIKKGDDDRENLLDEKHDADFLEPGYSLSGQKYLPDNNHIEFMAGLTFGLSAPQTLLADVAFGMELSNSSKDGWGVQKVYFKGGAYVMNSGLAKRQEAALMVETELIFNIRQENISGKFGIAVNVPPGVGEDKAFITGAYNKGLVSNNFYLNYGKKEAEFYFFAGKPKPEERMSIRFQLTDKIKLAEVQAYFMATANHKMPEMESLVEIFARHGFGDLTNDDRIRPFPIGSGSSGIAFGASIDIGGDYSFLFLRATFKAFAGFDVNITHWDNPPNCGVGGTFGINNWYFTGQAYAGIRAALAMHIDLGFYKGDISLFDMGVYAGINIQLPNPTYLTGMFGADYSILSGLIKGHFNFKFEAGEQCKGLDDYDPLAGIDLIQDLSPSGGTLEIYQSAAATFFVPMDSEMEFDVPTSNGNTEKRKYIPTLASARIYKSGSEIPMNTTYQDDGKTAVFQPVTILDAKTSYTLKVVVEVYRQYDNKSPIWEKTEEKEVTFRTGDRPQTIKTETIGYLAPGHGQRYWHKNYAQPFLEFDQLGWWYLFPGSDNVTFTTTDKELFERLKNDGWNAQALSPQLIKNQQALNDLRSSLEFNPILPEIRTVSRSTLERKVFYKYICRLRELKSGTVTEFELEDYPRDKPATILVPVFGTIVIGGVNYPIFLRNETQTLTGKKVTYPDLNNGSVVDLQKGGIYSLQIVRVPREKYTMGVATVEIENKKTVVREDTIVNTVEYTSREVKSGQTISGELKKAIDLLNDEKVLYTYHFAVSTYNSLADKIEDFKFDIDYNILTNRVYFPEDVGPAIYSEFGIKGGYTEYIWKNGSGKEPLDKYDKNSFVANSQFLEGTEYNNPIRDYIAIRNLFHMGGTSGLPEISFQRFLIPRDLYLDGHYIIDRNGKKLEYEKFAAYVEDITDYYFYENARGNKIRFDNHWPEVISASEISNKMLTPNNGNFKIYLTSYEAQTLRHSVAMYQHYVGILDQLKRQKKKYTNQWTSEYNTLINYYIETNGEKKYLPVVLYDVYKDNRLKGLKEKYFGISFRSNLYSPPEYMGVKTKDLNFRLVYLRHPFNYHGYGIQDQ